MCQGQLVIDVVLFIQTYLWWNRNYYINIDQCPDGQHNNLQEKQRENLDRIRKSNFVYYLVGHPFVIVPLRLRCIEMSSFVHFIVMWYGYFHLLHLFLLQCILLFLSFISFALDVFNQHPKILVFVIVNMHFLSCTTWFSCCLFLWFKM